MDRGQISTIIANRDKTLYSELHVEMVAIQNFLTESIKDICENMMYDFRDVYLEIVFKALFEGDDASVPIECKYRTVKKLEDETANVSYHDASNLNQKFTKNGLAYFDARILSVEELAKDFAIKKLGAYKFKATSDVVENSLTLTVTYILGDQKNKPTA